MTQINNNELNKRSAIPSNRESDNSSNTNNTSTNNN